MRKGGLHKPLILDKFSAEDLDTGAMDNKTQGAKSGTCQYVLNRPDSSRDPAGTEQFNPLRGEEQQRKRRNNICFQLETLKGV